MQLLSLTCDCWYFLGRFFDFEEATDTSGLLEQTEDGEYVQRKPWLLRLQNGKIHNVKAYTTDIELF
ncbi:hypothetical protein M3Y99_01464200 [Aphelenchoides fujianensis]|nr:hypothetical protein M3Y99_01464200 [Aphelenchoides fujianensis]